MGGLEKPLHVIYFSFPLKKNVKGLNKVSRNCACVCFQARGLPGSQLGLAIKDISPHVRESNTVLDSALYTVDSGL